MWFQVTMELDHEVIYEAVHEADATEAALRDAMYAARKAYPGEPVYLSYVTVHPLRRHGDP
jgi:hypothetical protein